MHTRLSTRCIVKVSFALTASMFVAGSGLYASADAPSKAASPAMYSQAATLAGERHWEAARPLLLKLANSRYADRKIFSWLADSYMADIQSNERDYKSAENALNQALLRSPEWGTAWRQKANLANNREDSRLAIEMANRAISCKEPDYDGYYQRAKAYAALKDYKRALTDDEEYIKRCPRKGPPKVIPGELSLKAALLEKLGRYDDAIEVYRSLLVCNFDGSTLNIVRCLRNENKLSEAIKEISLLIAKNSKDDQAFYQRASLKSQSRDWAGALADYNKAIELSPLSRYYAERAKVYEAMHKPAEAAADRKKSQNAEF